MGSIGTLLQQVLTLVKTDALKSALPVIQGFLGSIIADPSQLNIIARFNQLNIDLMATLPSTMDQFAKDLATLLQSEIAKLQQLQK